jgi:hypothetical protein
MLLSRLFICTWLFLLAFPPQQTKTITSEEAKAHAGETAVVCGIVASVYEPRKKLWRPTFLNFDKKYPATEFSVLIWRKDRAAVGSVRQFAGRRICVSGEVYLYRDRAQVKLMDSKSVWESVGYGILNKPEK